MKLRAQLKESKEKLVRANNKDGYQLCVKKKKKPVSNLLTIYRSLAEFQTILTVCRDAWLSAKRKKFVWGVWVRTCMSKIGTDREKFEQVRAGFRYTRIARTSESFEVSEYRNSIRLSATDLCISTSERAVYLCVSSTKA